VRQLAIEELAGLLVRVGLSVKCGDYALVAMERAQVVEVGFGERLAEQASGFDLGRR